MRPASDAVLQIQLGIPLPRPQNVQLEDGALELADDGRAVDPLLGRERGGRVDGRTSRSKRLLRRDPALDGRSAHRTGIATLSI